MRIRIILGQAIAKCGRWFEYNFDKVFEAGRHAHGEEDVKAGLQHDFGVDVIGKTAQSQTQEVLTETVKA